MMKYNKFRTFAKMYDNNRVYVASCQEGLLAFRIQGCFSHAWQLDCGIPCRNDGCAKVLKLLILAVLFTMMSSCSLLDPEVPEPKEIEVPEVSVPEIDIPKMQVREMDVPEMKVREMDVPKMKVREIDVPEMKVREIDVPEMEVREMDVPEAESDLK
jgi:hypothetical protein